MAYLYYPKLGSNGRLGNQCFAIASTIGIALKNGMVPRFPENWQYRQYFNIPDEYFGPQDVPDVLLKEPHFHYCEPEINPFLNTALDGYFQSPKYWAGYERYIKEMFTPKWNEISRAIGVHYRRGDYVNNPNYSQLPMSYYINAYEQIIEQKPDYEEMIYAFSDDYNYVGVHHKNQTAVGEIDDLMGMIEQKAHIVSNSTFSWWGAYLSKADIVVRPNHYFSGPLAKNNTDDFWPKEWHVLSSTLRTCLKDVTFIIPVKIDHPDRLQNLQYVTAYLNHHFDTNIIIGEIDTNQVKGAVKFHYGGKFHRTRCLNEMTAMAKTPIVFNWDCDVLTSPWNIYLAVRKLRAGYDIVSPFDGSFAGVPRQWLQKLKGFDIGVFGNTKFRLMGNNNQAYGGAIGYKVSSFWKAGGENENFISYGPEDQERWWRFQQLGLKMARIPGTIYHIDHHRGPDSKEGHRYSRANHQYFEWLKKQDLPSEIEKWQWVKAEQLINSYI